MRVTRIITYESDNEGLERQLSQSMPDGTRVLGKMSITITTLPSRWGLWRPLKALIKRA